VTARGPTLTIGAPTNARDGAELDITIHNMSGGAITTTWNSAFKMSPWTEPATGFNRSAQFRYDSSRGASCLISMTTADVPD
jgi:hypothetical protein